MVSFAPDEAHAPTPPVPPPKPGNSEASRVGTPAPDGSGEPWAASQPLRQSEPGPDPGEGWLPSLLQDMSTQDLAALAASPSLLAALTHSPQAIHPTLAASHADVSRAVLRNSQLASQLSSLATRLSHQRSTTQAQLLATHALERQWRQKQAHMDDALSPFSPASLYQRLAQGVQEQGAVCHALEESFLEGEGGARGLESERGAADWVRRYREAKVQFYLRQDRKERWDEGRVGGWR